MAQILLRATLATAQIRQLLDLDSQIKKTMETQKTSNASKKYQIPAKTCAFNKVALNNIKMETYKYSLLQKQP